MLISYDIIFEKIAGWLLDHTIPTDDMLTLSAAYMLGATIIEKRFTDDKSKREMIITMPWIKTI